MALRPVPQPGEEDRGFGSIAALAEQGIESVLVTAEGDLDSIRAGDMPALAVVDVGSMPAAEFAECVRRCSQMGLPAIALVPEDRLGDIDLAEGVDDFILGPPRPDELVMRARLALSRTPAPDEGDLLRVGDLVINRTNYEVSVKGRRVNLRFKEYELLLLIASSPGRVYTREALLNLVWGYDYLGGTRTVDVHVRRLRSKIEDANHSFIETVWNVGYRFRDIASQL